jgi:hypothetical protein
MKGKKVLFTVFCILLCVSIGTVVSAAEKKGYRFHPHDDEQRILRYDG